MERIAISRHRSVLASDVHETRMALPVDRTCFSTREVVVHDRQSIIIEDRMVPRQTLNSCSVVPSWLSNELYCPEFDVREIGRQAAVRPASS